MNPIELLYMMQINDNLDTHDMISKKYKKWVYNNDEKSE